MLSYQCSQHSTSQSIIDVFKTAKSFQKNQNTTKYVSVVVLDEIGLAEDSPNLPLKALHPLLEDGTDGADNQKVKQKFLFLKLLHISTKGLYNTVDGKN